MRFGTPGYRHKLFPQPWGSDTINQSASQRSETRGYLVGARRRFRSAYTCRSGADSHSIRRSARGTDEEGVDDPRFLVGSTPLRWFFCSMFFSSFMLFPNAPSVLCTEAFSAR
jgi:hypothetical protein